MCWSARVSLNTYIVALFGAAFALANGASLKFIAWMLLFSHMQLVEFFIWKNINSKHWNRIFSWLGLIVLVLEPIASMMLMNPGYQRNFLLVAYAVFCAAIVFLYWPWTPRTTVAPNGHLRWHWQHPKMPMASNLVWLAFFIVPLFLAEYYLAGALAVLTVALTMYTYLKHETWGSMWCWIANASWLLIIGAYALDRCKKKNQVIGRAE